MHECNVGEDTPRDIQEFVSNEIAEIRSSDLVGVRLPGTYYTIVLMIVALLLGHFSISSLTQTKLHET